MNEQLAHMQAQLQELQRQLQLAMAAPAAATTRPPALTTVSQPVSSEYEGGSHADTIAVTQSVVDSNAARTPVKAPAPPSAAPVHPLAGMLRNAPPPSLRKVAVAATPAPKQKPAPEPSDGGGGLMAQIMARRAVVGGMSSPASSETSSWLSSPDDAKPAAQRRLGDSGRLSIGSPNGKAKLFSADNQFRNNQMKRTASMRMSMGGAGLASPSGAVPVPMSDEATPQRSTIAVRKSFSTTTAPLPNAMPQQVASGAVAVAVPLPTAMKPAIRRGVSFHGEVEVKEFRVMDIDAQPTAVATSTAAAAAEPRRAPPLAFLADIKRRAVDDAPEAANSSSSSASSAAAPPRPGPPAAPGAVAARPPALPTAAAAPAPQAPAPAAGGSLLAAIQGFKKNQLKARPPPAPAGDENRRPEAASGAGAVATVAKPSAAAAGPIGAGMLPFNPAAQRSGLRKTGKTLN